MCLYRVIGFIFRWMRGLRALPRNTFKNTKRLIELFHQLRALFHPKASAFHKPWSFFCFHFFYNIVEVFQYWFVSINFSFQNAATIGQGNWTRAFKRSNLPRSNILLIREKQCFWGCAIVVWWPLARNGFGVSLFWEIDWAGTISLLSSKLTASSKPVK